MHNDLPPVCDYEGSDYQTSFWEKADRAYEDRVEAIALRRLLPPRGKCLLEIGAGAGRNTPRYAGFERIILLDYSRTQLQQAQERLGGGERFIYVAANAYRLPFNPGFFDAATMIRTLHHMAAPEQILQQVRQVLKPGGVFILEFANKRNLKAILRYALRRQSWNPFTLEPVEFAALNYDFHPTAVRGWLERSGFNIERQLSVSHFRFDLLKRMVPLPILVQLDALAQFTGNLWQLSPSVFIRASAAGDQDSRSPGKECTPEALFCCPQCGSAQLYRNQEALLCPGCGRAWEIHKGIYDFKI